jgi:hypothetical protein
MADPPLCPFGIPSWPVRFYQLENVRSDFLAMLDQERFHKLAFAIHRPNPGRFSRLACAKSLI